MQHFRTLRVQRGVRLEDLRGCFNSPRTYKCFDGVAQKMVAEHGLMDIPEYVRRASCNPAAVVADATKGAVRKGSLAVGADADVVVFDPGTYRDQATYDACTRASTGVRHLIVAGTPVVRDGALQLDVRPGLPIRGA